MICTIPSGSTLTNVTRSRPGIRSTPNAIYVRKEWIPQPEFFSDEMSAPSLRTVRKRSARIVESSARTTLVPRDSSTY